MFRPPLPHFGHAAERCFVSQPTLSIAVKKLEDELGIALFERSKNAVRVTPIGEKIVQQAQKVLEQAEAIKELSKQGKDQLASPLRVGAIYTIGPYLFPKLIPEVQRIAPQMHDLSAGARGSVFRWIFEIIPIDDSEIDYQIRFKRV